MKTSSTTGTVVCEELLYGYDSFLDYFYYFMCRVEFVGVIYVDLSLIETSCSSN